MSDLCIYHGGCPDGFTAAWVVHERLPDRDIEFWPGRYGDPPPRRPGADVLIVDFSYPKDVLLGMCEWANSVQVLDHHASAERDLADAYHAKLHVQFDMKRSGAMIVWDHFNPGDTPPDIVSFVQDRDLWRHAIPNTEEYIANLKSHPYTFDAWTGVANTPLAECLAAGAAILRSNRAVTQRIIETCTRSMVIAGYEVKVVNCPYDFGSDAAGTLAEGEPFAAYYLDRGDARQFGLRSADDGMDVSLVAAEYDGGGHPHAAGFTVPRDHELGTC